MVTSEEEMRGGGEGERLENKGKESKLERQGKKVETTHQLLLILQERGREKKQRFLER